MRIHRTLLLFIVLAAAVLHLQPAAIAGETADSSAGEISFVRDIQPVLAAHCLVCHGLDKAEGGLRLTRRESATAPLDSGNAAIVAGKPEQSELIRRVTADDPDERMPPKG